MPPSERNAAQSDQEDDVLERTPSHPVTTTLLIVSALTLILAIGITVTELERYVNRETRSQLSDFKKTAVMLHEETYGAPAADDEGKPAVQHRRVNKEEDKPAPEEKTPEAPPPAEQPAPAAPTGESAGG